jgi:uncharacterized protein YxjI
VDGQVWHIGKTLLLKDAQGNELCRIQEQVVSIRKQVKIERPDGQPLATITKSMFTVLREQFTVQVPGTPDIEIQGSVLDHEYRFEQSGRCIAMTSKNWFQVADAYGVQVEPEQDHLLILAVTVGLDALAHRA